MSDGYEANFEDEEIEVLDAAEDGSPLFAADAGADDDAVFGDDTAEGDPLEGADTNRVGICRLKSTDDMETQAFVCDTLAGIECDENLPNTLPLEVHEHAPVLHRTSGVVSKDTDMPPPAEAPSKGPRVIEELVHPLPSQVLADSESFPPDSQQDCYLIEDSPVRPSGSTNPSPQDRVDMYAQMISRLEHHMAEVSRGSADSAVVTVTHSLSSGHG